MKLNKQYLKQIKALDRETSRLSKRVEQEESRLMRKGANVSNEDMAKYDELRGRLESTSSELISKIQTPKYTK